MIPIDAKAADVAIDAVADILRTCARADARLSHVTLEWLANVITASSNVLAEAAGLTLTPPPAN